MSIEIVTPMTMPTGINKGGTVQGTGRGAAGGAILGAVTGNFPEGAAIDALGSDIRREESRQNLI